MTAPEHPAAAPTTGGIAVYFERPVLVMTILGFAAGLPFLLIFDTLSVWLRQAGLTLEVIGFFALATFTYSLKFLWAPLIDRTPVPVLSQVLGHRRAWMLVTQAAIILGLWMIAGSDPGQSLGTVAAFAVTVGFFGATQDISIDAWRIEATDDSRQGAMAAAYQVGYRVAFITAGALPLILADLYNWNFSYAVMAGLMGFGVLGVLLAPKEKAHIIRLIPVGDLPSRPGPEAVEWALRLGLILVAAMVIGTGLTAKPDFVGLVFSRLGLSAETVGATLSDPQTGVFVQFATVVGGFALLVAACWPIPGHRTRPGAYLAGSFGAPLKDFFDRFGDVAMLILALICLYRLSDFVLNIMGPFYLDLGFTQTEIATVRKLFGVFASLAGALIGGWSVAKLGLLRTMVIGVFASPVSNLVFAWLAMQGPEISALYVAICLDNVATGYAGVALIAYMSSLTSIGFTATQYALFASLYALPGKLIASQSGRIVESSARAAEGDGMFASLRGLFANLPAGSLVEGALKSGVTPAALGSGYVVFFLYSTAIGVFAVVLAFVVARKQKVLQARNAEAEAIAETEAHPS